MRHIIGRFLLLTMLVAPAIAIPQVAGAEPAGNISTVAGSGTQGFSGDEGPATAATLYYPQGMDFDPFGSLYFAEWGNGRIRKLTRDGLIHTVAGDGKGSGTSPDGGSATSVSINMPIDVAVDSAGNLYIADQYTNRIRKVDASGTISTVAGDGRAAYAGDGGPATAASLYEPLGIAVDFAGNLYIADTYNRRVRKVDTAGIITTLAGNGTGSYQGDGGPAASASLYWPSCVTVDAAGNLYICDGWRVRKVDTSGTITKVAGTDWRSYSGDGGLAADASLNEPSALAVDGTGDVFIADVNNQRVRKIDHATGVITTVVGNGAAGFSGDGGPATEAALYYPSGVAVDAAGDLYVGDTHNNRVRKVEGIAAPAPRPRAVRYVALGDSYSSGEGLAPYLSGSHQDDPKDYCDRSNRAYGPQLNDHLSLGPLTFVACSGAVTQDFFAPNHSYPTEPAQIRALTATTETVTFTIGGNDAGFSPVLKACVRLRPFRWNGYRCSKDKKLVDAVNNRIAALRGDGSATTPEGTDVIPIQNLLVRISQLAPNATIYVAGYPALFGSSSSNYQHTKSAPSGYTCTVGDWNEAPATVDYSDAQWINSEGVALNNAISAAVLAAQSQGVRAYYVDRVTVTFQTHGLCDSGTPWTNPLSFTGPTVWPGSFHPTETGQSAGYEAAFAYAMAGIPSPL